MKQSYEDNCNCISNLFDSQERWFLTRKSQADQIQSSPNSRRSQYPSHIKEQPSGKSKKKSLKKRSNSNISSNIHILHPEMVEANKMETQMKINKDNNSFNNQPDASLSKAIEIPFIRQTFSPSVYRNEPQKMKASFIEQLNYASIPDYEQIEALKHRANLHSNPTNSEFPYQQKRYEEKSHPYQIKQQLRHQAEHQPKFTRHKEEQALMKKETPQQIGQKVHHPIVYNQQETESWIPIREDSLIIEQFNRLFKNKEEHQSHQNLNQDSKTHLRAREAKKSKRLEHQQLFGRFAESDEDEACSDAASQVIGKGFQSHFQKLNDFQQYHIEETMATRSTNTKISQANKREISEESYKPRFGGNHKSYKYL